MGSRVIDDDDDVDDDDDDEMIKMPVMMIMMMMTMMMIMTMIVIWAPVNTQGTKQFNYKIHTEKLKSELSGNKVSASSRLSSCLLLISTCGNNSMLGGSFQNH